MSELIDEVLAGLDASRRTMRAQMTTIDEIIDKSNKTLLFVEANNKGLSLPPGSIYPGHKTVNYKPEYELALARIMLNFQQLVQQQKAPDAEGQVSILDDCLAYQQRVETLGSSVRKLKALCDTVQQIKNQVKEQIQYDVEGEDSDKENENTALT